ncbi:MAG: bile acid:sodium symporter family protein [Gammaproteobacteria bacterium]|nr:bile acid:sodium symporter family protein [Gammaproteobacteria bacterium]
MGEIYVAYEYWFAAFQLIFAMLGMGATLTVSDFNDILKEPKAVTIGTLIQLVLIPVIAFLFIHSLGIVGGVAIGLALVASIPGGTTSNIFTYFAKGNIPLSISITAITTLACLLTTPIVLSLLITQYLPSDFRMPTPQIIREIGFTLLLPLAMGMAFLRLVPTMAQKFSKWCIRLSLLGIVAIVVGSSAAGRLDMEAFGTQNLLWVLLFIAAIGLVGWVAAKLLSLSTADSTAIEMEVIVRNVNLAILIKASMFPANIDRGDNIGDMVLFTALIYGALQMLVAAVLIFYKRKTRS